MPRKSKTVESMQVPRGHSTGADIMAFGRLGVWLGAGGKWNLADGGNIELYVNGRTLVANPGDWIQKHPDGTVTVSAEPEF